MSPTQFEKNVDIQKPGILFQPATSRIMLRGMDQIINAIRPTLGPLPRTVAIEPIATKNKRAEILDSGGTIARRIIQLKNRDEDVGAMFIRHVLCALQERAGDGTATAALLFQKIFTEGHRYIVNGGNAMILRRHLDSAIPLVLTELNQMVRHLSGKKRLTGLAMAISHDPVLSQHLGEIFDIIGDFGRLEIRTGRSRELEREYVEGLWWDTGVLSREMLVNKTRGKTTFEDSYVFISDLDIEHPNDLVPLLNMCVQNGVKTMLLISATLSGQAMGLLLSKQNRALVEVMAVRSPAATADARNESLEDIAVLTGGTVLSKAAGYKLSAVKFEHLGRARRIWGGANNFGIISGRGDARTVRAHVAALRKSYNGAKDNDGRKKILTRFGKLMGGSATLWIGANSPLEVEALKELAERTAEAMRGAIREGVVPGGGVALMDCRRVLRKAMEGESDLEKVAAYRILIKALEVPFRTILQNAGIDLDGVVPLVTQAGAGYGYDVINRKVVCMVDAEIFDAASVVRAGLHAALSGAGLALSTDVIIHRKSRPVAVGT